MSRKMKATALAALVVGGFALGVLFASQLNVDVHWKSAPAAPSADDAKSKEEVQRTISEASRTFTTIAKEVTPSVVTISSSKVFRPSASRRPSEPRGEEGEPNPFDLFHRFFEDGGPGQREFRQQGLGSGVIVSEDGYIITNNHVVANADEIEVGLEDGRHIAAKLVGTDPKSDIAVVKIDARGLDAVEMGDSDRLEVGEWVLAVGSPFSENLSHSVTAGIVSAMERSYVGLTDYEEYIQTDAAINPGNSGGALVDMEGKVVGISTAIATRSGGSQGVGFAIPINMARDVMESLIRDGKVTRGWLGVLIQNVTDEIAEARGLTEAEGVLVGDVTAGSPAEKAGLERGDVITEIEGNKIRNTAQLRNLVARTKPGTRVDLTILRDGRSKEVTLALGVLPEDPEVASAEESEESVEKLGLEVSPITAELREAHEIERERGVVVTGVANGSVAARYDIREGDVILEVNGESVETVREYAKAIDGLESDEAVMLLVERGGATHFVAFKVPK
jgi:serine protease Do